MDDEDRVKRALVAIGAADGLVDPVLFAQAIKEANRRTGWDKRCEEIIAEAKSQDKSIMSAFTDACKRGESQDSSLIVKIYHQLLLEKSH